MMTEETIEQKIARLSSIKPGDSDYAESQFRLGIVSELTKKEFDTAINYYQNVRKEDNAEYFAKAQFRLGIIFELKKKELDTAIHYYQNVRQEDSEEGFARAQIRLGLIFEIKKKELDTAIGYYKKAIQKDDFECYVLAQYCLGRIYLEKENNEEAKKHYNNVSYIKNGFNLYTEAQIALFFLSNKTDKPIKLGEIGQATKSINNIYQFCGKIRNQSLVRFDKNNHYEQTIAHYTNPNVLFLLLKQASLFRLNLVDFMNDPSENKVLLNWLNIDPSQTNPDIKNFVASFSFNHNSLNQFRLYGLEGNQPGSGVSLTFKKDFFCDELDKSIDLQAITKSPQKLMNSDTVSDQQSNRNLTIFPLPLYRCIYFDPNTNYLALAKRSKQSFYLEYKSEKPDEIDKKWQGYLTSLEEEQKLTDIREQLDKVQTEIKKLRELIDKNEWQITLKDINQLIALATMPIASLVKHAAFEDENECRIFYVTDIGDDKVKIGEQFDLCQQIYLEYGDISTYLDKIYLGPKCQPQHKLWLENHNKKRKLNINRIVQSVMPLQ
ncbi:DUF2971 domain-containing protein [Orbus wheelerorum]|uniref:tetratricopeptide repeat protein n=1 Tax=Orbus wheelerorum TaxID=3074111 RepID=UPI00370D5C6B